MTYVAFYLVLFTALMFPIYITNECKKKLMTQLPCDYLVLHFLTFGTVLSTHTNTNTLQCKRKSSKSSNVEINNLSSCCLETWRPPLDVAIHIENRNLVIMQLYAQFELKLMTLLCTRRRSSFLLGRYIFFAFKQRQVCLQEIDCLCRCQWWSTSTKS